MRAAAGDGSVARGNGESIKTSQPWLKPSTCEPWFSRSLDKPVTGRPDCELSTALNKALHDAGNSSIAPGSRGGRPGPRLLARAARLAATCSSARNTALLLREGHVNARRSMHAGPLKVLEDLVDAVLTFEGEHVFGPVTRSAARQCKGTTRLRPPRRKLGVVLRCANRGMLAEVSNPTCELFS